MRARYLDVGAGRFTQMDEWQGRALDPITLNKYVYGNSNPVGFVDPSGRFGIIKVAAQSVLVGAVATLSYNNSRDLMEGHYSASSVKDVKEKEINERLTDLADPSEILKIVENGVMAYKRGLSALVTT